MKKDILAFAEQVKAPILLIILLWVIEAAKHIFDHRLQEFGIFPRAWDGFFGIFTGPFVHGSWGHLASNTLPLLALTSMMVTFYPKAASQAMAMIMTGTGIMVWLFARPAYHIGASGVVYGLVAFLFWTGVFKKNAKSTVLALIVLTLYAGSVESMFPGVEKNISWESHLFGAMVGLVTAFILKGVVEEDEKNKNLPSWHGETTEKQYFLPRDAFEKTKIQRYYEYVYSSQNEESGNI